MQNFMEEEVTWTIERTGDSEWYRVCDNDINNNINNNTIDIEQFTQNTISLNNNDYANDEFIPFNNHIPIIESVKPFKVEDNICCICFEDKKTLQFCQINCNHIFCYTCIKTHQTQSCICPLCREPFTHIYKQK